MQPSFHRLGVKGVASSRDGDFGNQSQPAGGQTPRRGNVEEDCPGEEGSRCAGYGEVRKKTIKGEVFARSNLLVTLKSANSSLDVLSMSLGLAHTLAC